MAVAYLKLNRPEQALILCGGLGTRLRPHTDQLPKPMIPCNGKPFLWYLLKQMEEQGIKRFVLLTGYLAEKIKGYFKDGSTWGWQIQYSQGPVDWDTGKRIWEVKEKMDDRFLLLYSDNFVPFPMEKVLALHNKNDLALTFMISQKSPGNIALDEARTVQKYDSNRSVELEYVEIGYMIVEKEKTLKFFETPECSFSSILQKMAIQKQISAWIQHDAYHSISDPKRWRMTETYLKPEKILLIDRDGVINRKAPKGEYISSWEDFEWIPETRDALKILAREGFKFIVISNQAGVARGMIDPNELDRIHNFMKVELKKDGIEILDIYVCPHHWDEGCFCRKPNPGMLFQASHEHLFRLDKTLFIGDDPRDCQTAERAGCGSIFVGDTPSLKYLSIEE
ncbi:MAG: HAD-IIIA family hydrolase, partial [Deltaproteobacteria bacterium]|nr:HAD-IIIA family hydrolase [Deltaproteobacteria bacterium]